MMKALPIIIFNHLKARKTKKKEIIQARIYPRELINKDLRRRKISKAPATLKRIQRILKWRKRKSESDLLSFSQAAQAQTQSQAQEQTN